MPHVEAYFNLMYFMVVCLKWISTIYSNLFLNVNSFYGNNLLLCIICISTNFNIDVMSILHRLKQMWHIWIKMTDHVCKSLTPYVQVYANILVHQVLYYHSAQSYIHAGLYLWSHGLPFWGLGEVLLPLVLSNAQI